MIRLLCSALLSLFVLGTAPSLRGGEFQEDLKARRTRVMEKLLPDSMLILWSAPVRNYSHDVEYEYRQDSNLYYLTGIDQEETIVVLLPGNARRKEFLFVKEKNPVREHWQGHILSKQEATAQSGIETVLLSQEFEPFVHGVLSRSGFGSASRSECEAYFKALAEGRARIALLLEPHPGLKGPLTPQLEFANRVRERYFGFSIVDATPVLHELRQIKTSHERKILEKSLEITCEAHMVGMQAARPGAYEYEVEAAIEHVYKTKGALGWGYPSIVGSGPNATILHYSKSTRKMGAGDLLLVDAAANYEYLTGDVTRTYPVSGTFSPAQKDIYRIVLEAQEAGIRFVRAGVTLPEIHQKTVEVIKDGLFKLGLITDKSGDQYRLWYTHGACHFIGMDVHDVGRRERPLEPGMAFVIEPGIYIREGALENLPRTSENASLIEKVRPAYEKYKHIGVRIEDSFLLTESGLKQLSAKVPRSIEAIENLIKTRPTTAP